QDGRGPAQGEAAPAAERGPGGAGARGPARADGGGRTAAVAGGLPRPGAGDEPVPARRRGQPLQAVARGALRARPGARPGAVRVPRSRGDVLRLAPADGARLAVVRRAPPRRSPSAPAALGRAGPRPLEL